MRFATELSPTELATTVRQMTTIVGWQNWQNRINNLKLEQPSNPIWNCFLRERHSLELAFGEVHRHMRVTDRCPWPPRTAEEYRLYSFLAVAVRIHSRLSESGQARFIGGIRSGLEKECGLEPRAFEVKVAAHLMGRGFEVDFHDYETGGGFDFLGRLDGIQVEVECKHLSADIGRQIHRRKMYILGGALWHVMLEAAQNRHSGLLVEVTLPGRLTGNKDEQQELADRICAVISGKVAQVEDSICTVTKKPFSLEMSPFTGERGRNLTMMDVRNHLSEAFGIDNANALLHWRPDAVPIIVKFESERPDQVLDRIFQTLKGDAKRQFTGSDPAILCVHMADLSEVQLRELAQADQAGNVTGLQRAASIVLQIRPHLHTIAIMTDGDVKFTQQRVGDQMTTSVQETGPSYVFRNPDHPLADHPSLEGIFV